MQIVFFITLLQNKALPFGNSNIITGLKTYDLALVGLNTFRSEANESLALDWEKESS